MDRFAFSVHPARPLPYNPGQWSKPPPSEWSSCSGCWKKRPATRFSCTALRWNTRRRGCKQAIEFLDKVIGVDSGYCYAYHQRGLVYESLGEMEAAPLLS